MSDEQVTINKDEYDSLVLAAKKLNALELAGVSDWEWYYEALDSVEGESEEDNYWDDEDDDDEY